MQIPRLPIRSIRLESTPWTYESKPFYWDSPPLEHYILSIGIKGEVELLHDDVTFEQKPWRAAVIPPGTHNRAPLQDEFTNFSAHFSVNRPDRKMGLPFIITDLIEIELCQSLINACMQIALDPAPLSIQQKELLILQLLTLVWRSHHNPNHSKFRYRKLHDQVNRFRSGEDLFRTTKELAQEAHMSRVHYSNCFKQLFKSTPNRFLIQCRIEKACILLKTTDHTLETISEIIGYNDVHFFIRQFQSMKRTTPNQFRVQPQSDALH